MAISEYYSQFNSKISEINETEKKVRSSLDKLRVQIAQDPKSPTANEEGQIRRQINEMKDLTNKLEEAYNNRNVPSGFPGPELDRRQKEIQNIKIRMTGIDQGFQDVLDKKYGFVSTRNYDGYAESDEMKGMSNSELLQYQKEKIQDQDKQIDEITLDVKKGQVMAKEAGHQLDEQNKQLDQLQEDIDRLDSRMKKASKKFENYVAQQSGCKIIFILILELAAALAIYLVFTTG